MDSRATGLQSETDEHKKIPPWAGFTRITSSSYRLNFAAMRKLTNNSIGNIGYH